MRNLILVLGDQLNFDSPALEGFDPTLDSLLMIEVRLRVWYVGPRRLLCAGQRSQSTPSCVVSSLVVPPVLSLAEELPDLLLESPWYREEKGGF